MRRTVCCLGGRFLGVHFSVVMLVFGVLVLPLYAGELAGVRFDKGSDVERYDGIPYLWTGNGQITLTSPLQPSPDQKLLLLAGSKNDQRAATLTINGKPQTLRYGGKEGFQWIEAAVPKGVSGKSYVIGLNSAPGAKAGFFAEVRLVTADTSIDSLSKSLPDEKMAFTVSHPKPNRPEAFPEMRPLWDTKVELPETGDAAADKRFAKAEQNSRQAAEMFFRSRRFIDGWLAHADPKTGLIPRNLGENRDFWNARDAAADNYPFMVITSSLTDRKLFEGRMLDMLKTETRLTRRLGNLPDTWSFKKQAFLTDEPNQFEIRFGSSEYVKDGLLPITEWLGDSPWRDRMIGIVDDLFQYADFETPFGKVPTSNIEVHGDLLQVLSRFYWMTGDEKYLDWGCRLGDYYLLGKHHPTRDLDRLALNDHGCEIISGLAELYLATRSARPEKAKQYKAPLYEIYDRVLEIGRTPEGQFYSLIYPKKGTHIQSITDNWGYNYLGFYTLYLLDGKEAYRDAVVHALKNLPKLIEYDWGDVADEYADSIEGALSLYNREPVPEAAYWMDSEIHEMWSKQTSDGVIEGWHGDGNLARTAIMYAMWKTRGVHVEPWRADVRIGAEQVDGKLYVVLVADKPWSGQIKFDTPRYRLNMHLPIDYPRLNQFPEWFTVEAEKSYQVKNCLTSQSATEMGKTLSTDGYPVQLKAKEPLLLEVTDR